MEILHNLSRELKKHLEQKKEELSNSGANDSHTFGYIKLSEDRIEEFTKAIDRVPTNPLNQSEIIKNFTIKAEAIKADIEKIEIPDKPEEQGGFF